MKQNTIQILREAVISSNDNTYSNIDNVVYDTKYESILFNMFKAMLPQDSSNDYKDVLKECGVYLL